MESDYQDEFKYKRRRNLQVTEENHSMTANATYLHGVTHTIGNLVKLAPNAEFLRNQLNSEKPHVFFVMFNIGKRMQYVES